MKTVGSPFNSVKRFPDIEINRIPFPAPRVIDTRVHPLLLRSQKPQPGPHAGKKILRPETLQITPDLSHPTVRLKRGTGMITKEVFSSLASGAGGRSLNFSRTTPVTPQAVFQGTRPRSRPHRPWEQKEKTETRPRGKRLSAGPQKHCPGERSQISRNSIFPHLFR